MDNLKPCPFCGGEAKLRWGNDEDGDEYFYAQCTQCGGQTNGYFSFPGEQEGHDKAKAAWNRRKEPERVQYEFEHKGYLGSSEMDEQGYFGKVLRIKDLVNYEAKTREELEPAFREAVDNYLRFCKRVGKEPDHDEH